MSLRASLIGMLALAFLRSASVAADAPPVRFVLLTDIHLNTGTTAFRGAIQEINAMAPKPIAVVITGDLTVHGLPEELDSYLAEVAKLDQSIPVLAVPGNHEVVGEEDCLKNYQEKVRRDLYYSQDLAGIHFIGLSPLPLHKLPRAGKPDQTHKGYMDEPQLEWLAKDLASPAAQQAKWVIMFDHFPLWGDYGAYEIQNTEWEGRPNNGQKRILALMEQYKVGAFLVGHRHHANMPPTVHTFSNGSFAMHIMNETSALTRRPGFNVYEVGDKQISSYRQVLGISRVSTGQRLYDVAFNNPRTNTMLATAPVIQVAVSGQAVKVSWEALPNGQVEIHRRTEQGDSPWLLAGAALAAEGNFADSLNPDGFPYSYRIRVKTSDGYSGFSNTATTGAE